MPVDAYACFVFPVRSFSPADLPSLGWTPGPLPIPIPRTSGQDSRNDGSPTTDRAARTGYFAERVHPFLYGRDGSSGRWHRFLSNPEPDARGCLVEAWEVLAATSPEGPFLAVAHVQLGPDPVPSLAALAALHGPLASTAPAPLVSGDERPRVVSHLMWDGTVMPEPPLPAEARDALSAWTPVQRWQWFLASATAPADQLPDTEEPDVLGGTVWLSRDWRALTLRDGISFVGLAPRTDPPAGVLASFHDAARAYVRSIHVDVLLLGTLQLHAVYRFADAIGRIDVAGLRADSVEQLETDLLGLRTGLWWDQVGRRGGQASDVLAAFQQQHRMPELYTKIIQDLTDASRFVQVREAAAADAARAAEAAKQLEQDARQQELERSLAVISFVLLPLSIVFSGMALWSDPSPALLWVSLGIGVAIITGALIGLPTVRGTLRRGRQ